MNKQQGLKEPKLSNSEISAPSCLRSFKSHNADADVSGCDHIHIVRTIADRQSGLLGEPLPYHMNYVCLLLR
jgi:hypothetical protein